MDDTIVGRGSEGGPVTRKDALRYLNGMIAELHNIALRNQLWAVGNHLEAALMRSSIELEMLADHSSISGERRDKSSSKD